MYPRSRQPCQMHFDQFTCFFDGAATGICNRMLRGRADILPKTLSENRKESLTCPGETQISEQGMSTQYRDSLLKAI